MKIYKVTITTSEMGHQIAWAGNLREARRVLAEMKRGAKSSGETWENPDIDPYDMLTNKQGLLDFLRKHTPSYDNGRAVFAENSYCNGLCSTAFNLFSSPR